MVLVSRNPSWVRVSTTVQALALSNTQHCSVYRSLGTVARAGIGAESRRARSAFIDGLSVKVDDCSDEQAKSAKECVSHRR